MKNTLIFIGFIMLAVLITYALIKCGKPPIKNDPSDDKVPGTPNTPGAP